MSELPCVGAGITVVDPGSENIYAKGRGGFAPHRRYKGTTKGHLLKAYVTGIDDALTKNANPHLAIYWQCGTRSGHLSPREEGITWARGHGPQARGALLAQRALERQ